MDRTGREWALEYAQQGFFVIQLADGAKEPLAGQGWLHHASNNPKIVEELFRRNPNMNWGACSGPHFVILDLDVGFGKNGEAALFALEMEHGELPDTFKVRTPSGGIHILLHVPHAVTNAHNFPDGIDVRGGHGYVVGPGSKLVEGLCKSKDTPGEYTHIEGSLDNIAHAPDWVIERLNTPGADDVNHDVSLCDWDLEQNLNLARNFLETRDPAIEGHGGDGWTVNTAAFMRDYGLSEEMALKIFVETGWNDRCEPPWPLNELALKIRNGYRYSENRPGCKRDRIYELMEMRGIPPTPEELHEKFEASPLERLTLQRAREIAEQEPEKERPERGYYYSGGFMDRGERREYVIPGWLPAHGITALLARRGVGKSTILLDLACRIAHGMDWHGLDTTAQEKYEKDDWKVVYLCGEDDEGLELNMIGWHIYHGKLPTNNLIIRDGITNLMSEDDVKKEIEKIAEMVGNSRVIIIIDTWQRATAAGRQNADDEMNLAIRTAETMAESFNGPTIIAVHPPKAKESRHTILGHSFIENATSAIWFLEEAPDGLKLSVTRIKGPGHGNWFKFEKKLVELQTNDKFGKKEIGLIPLKFAGVEDEGSEQALSTEETKRMAIAWAIRGCYDFPRRDNIYEPFQLNPKACADFILDMHINRNTQTKEKKAHPASAFCTDYLYKYHMDISRDLTVDAVSHTLYGFLKYLETDNDIDFNDMAETKIQSVLKKKGSEKCIFAVTDKTGRAANLAREEVNKEKGG